MSQHLQQQVWIGYSPSSDAKWKPENMELGKWYQVYGYENGTLKRADGAVGEAFYYHFIGDGNRPSRLIQSSSILVIDSNMPKSDVEKSKLFDKIVKEHNAGSASSISGDSPF